MKIGWMNITAHEAAELELEQPCRWQWQLLGFEIFGFGMSFLARARPL